MVLWSDTFSTPEYSIHSGILCSYVLCAVYMELSWVVPSARLLSKGNLVIVKITVYVFLIYERVSLPASEHLVQG